jgi:hypothetical protein
MNNLLALSVLIGALVGGYVRPGRLGQGESMVLGAIVGYAAQEFYKKASLHQEVGREVMQKEAYDYAKQEISAQKTRP